MASPPKPWERAGSIPASASTMASPLSVASTLSSTSTALTTPSVGPGTTDLTPTSATGATSANGPPTLPDRPASLDGATASRTAYAARPTTTPMNTYGGYNGGYGSAYSSPYGAPYSRLGGMGGMGGMGGIGGMGGMGGYGYGGYGGGMGGMYGGMPGGMGMGMDPNNPNSLTNQFSQNTQATFQLLEGLVGTFTGFAQMLESTYMATHSSFFAMVGVAEQFGNLRNTLGNILGIFTLLRWLRTLFAKLMGRPPPVDATALTPFAFAKFEGRKAPAGSDAGPGATPKPSRKPLLFFLAAAFGLPYLMNKLIKSLAASQEQRAGQAMVAGTGPDAAVFDPRNLEFCRVMWDYQPANQPAGSTEGLDLLVKKGDLVAVLSKTDPLGNSSEWWRCRARDGKVGYVPAAYLEVVTRNPVAARPAIAAAPVGKQPPSVVGGGSGSSTPALLPAVTTKPENVTAESFVKSQFLS